ncbi:MAG: hydrogenase formation protein HypD, partial [Desulfobaccales bacterium]
MKFIDEFRDKDLVQEIVRRIVQLTHDPATIMEVCGTHTMAAARFGLKSLLPEGLRLISGPGCPVCVTAQDDLDAFLALGGEVNMVLTSFGDMLRVPGSQTSLEQRRAQGAEVRVVYSPLDAVDLARREPGKQVVFFGVGFETTMPAVA